MTSSCAWEIVNGDCLALMAEMGDDSVALTLTDPPYEDTMHAAKSAPKRRSLRVDGGPELKPLSFASIEAIRADAAREIVRVTQGWALVFCTPEGIAAWRDAFEAAGAKYKRACFWIKPDSAPQMNGQGPAFAVEPFVAVWCGSGHSRWYGGGRRNWWKCPTNGPWRDGRHPTEKPSALMADLCQHFCDRGSLVFDPFAGSGSTGVGALKMGRRFLGVEIDQQWVSVATERLTAAEHAIHTSPVLDLPEAVHG
ncbi:MAG: DNA methyltransferase [Pseudorhizobium pelagicum]|uniref:DNA-methyltransferase n=1 Tax=Pseudorhizobium pelagicum TaxID=1509405 RepID=UPI003460169E